MAFLSPPGGAASQSVIVYEGYHEEGIHYSADGEALFFVVMGVSGPPI